MGWLRYSIAFIGVLTLFVVINLYNKPIINNPLEFTIESGETLSGISQDLKEAGLISYRSFFNLFVILSGSTEDLKSGTYVFEEGNTLIEVVQRLKKHDTQQEVNQITIFEGDTRIDMLNNLDETYRNFDQEYFLNNTKEGYLFPDTYTFFESVTTKEIIERLVEKQREIVVLLQEEFSLPEGISEKGWIILASIVEKEANTPESRRRIADILLRRLADEMPLQVDATFVYGVGKDSFTLTTEDLVSDHEYNTYTRKGLPPTPISNPGEDSLRSVLEPIENTAYYFLTGLDGEMYYADTYDQHLDNRRLYLNK